MGRVVPAQLGVFRPRSCLRLQGGFPAAWPHVTAPRGGLPAPGQGPGLLTSPPLSGGAGMKGTSHVSPFFKYVHHRGITCLFNWFSNFLSTISSVLVTEVERLFSFPLLYFFFFPSPRHHRGPGSAAASKPSPGSPGTHPAPALGTAQPGQGLQPRAGSRGTAAGRQAGAVWGCSSSCRQHGWRMPFGQEQPGFFSNPSQEKKQQPKPHNKL